MPSYNTKTRHHQLGFLIHGQFMGCFDLIGCSGTWSWRCASHRLDQTLASYCGWEDFFISMSLFSSTIAQVYKVWKFRSWSVFVSIVIIIISVAVPTNVLGSEKVPPPPVLFKTVPHNKNHFCLCVTIKCSHLMPLFICISVEIFFNAFRSCPPQPPPHHHCLQRMQLDSKNMLTWKAVYFINFRVLNFRCSLWATTNNRRPDEEGLSQNIKV